MSDLHFQRIPRRSNILRGVVESIVPSEQQPCDGAEASNQCLSPPSQSLLSSPFHFCAMSRKPEVRLTRGAFSADYSFSSRHTSMDCLK